MCAFQNFKVKYTSAAIVVLHPSTGGAVVFCNKNYLKEVGCGSKNLDTLSNTIQ
jgi:hypothetical protein